MGVSQANSERTTMLPDGRGKLFVRAVGDGPPIVVLHGGPEFDHEYLRPELDRLAMQFRVVYYDQRGRGRSFAGEGSGGVTIASEVEDLDRVRAWTRSESVALLGHSWGGLLAMEFAIAHPDRLSHLILVDTAPASHQDLLALRDELNSRRTPEELIRMRELRTDPAFLAGDIEAEAEFNRIHFRTTVGRPDQLDEVVRRVRVNFTPEGILASRAIDEALSAQTWGKADYDLIPALRALRIPTLVLRGENDFIPAEGMRRIADAIPGSRFVEIAGAGHFTFVEQPERVCSLIAEFVATS
jgi:proline iminopeptidase